MSIVNNANDRQISIDLTQSSLLSWVQCFISLLVGYAAIVGRVGFLEVLFFTLIGTVGYELN